MTSTDPIADMLCMIKNGVAVKHEFIETPYSKLKLDIVKVLKEEGYIKKYEVINRTNDIKDIRVILKYTKEGQSVISEIRRVSKPGKRIYVPKARIPKIQNGFGISIMSTNEGVITGKQARKSNVSGEFLAFVY